VRLECVSELLTVSPIVEACLLQSSPFQRCLFCVYLPTRSLSEIGLCRALSGKRISEYCMGEDVERNSSGLIKKTVP
jgi:hypothetical protein